MKISKSYPLKNRISFFFLSIIFISVIAFAWFLDESFGSGLEKSAKLRLISEYNGYAREYEKDTKTPFKNSYVINFYFDELPDIWVENIRVFDGFKLNDGEFEAVFVNELLLESDEYEPIYVVYANKLHDGRQLYVVATYDFALVGDDFDALQISQMSFVLSVVFSYLILTILALWYYSNIIGKKTSHLVSWAEETSSNFVEKDIPNFKFNEFNRVADCLVSSLKNNAKLIDKEKRFLAHASHELRTPIAIIKANLEIFEKLDLTDSAKGPLIRLERANANMQLITETLLWLARQNDRVPAQVTINLPNLLMQLIDEQNYLIQGEDVEVLTQFDPNEVSHLPLSPLMIVLNNLIRNAFQYTHHGWIKISFSDNRILIENHDTQNLLKQSAEGFGLGLELTQRICKKLDWKLTVNFQDKGVLAILYLPN